MCSPACGRHSGFRVSYGSAVLLEDDILGTFSKADHAQDGARNSGALHPELEWDAFAAKARQAEFPLVLDLAVVGCEIVQTFTRAIAFASFVLREGSWVTDIIDGARVD